MKIHVLHQLFLFLTIKLFGISFLLNLFVRKWRDIQLAVLQKAQLLVRSCCFGKCILIAITILLSHHDERTYPFPRSNILDSYLLRKHMSPMNVIMVRIGAMQNFITRSTTE
jgi:hypothetical protein